MSSWVIAEDCKLLLGIIMENCPKPNIKNVQVEGRSALACRRRFAALKETYGKDDNSDEEVLTTSRKSNGKAKSGDTSLQGSSNGTKRKTNVPVKRTNVKKVKKDEIGQVGPDVDAWLEELNEKGE